MDLPDGQKRKVDRAYIFPREFAFPILRHLEDPLAEHVARDIPEQLGATTLLSTTLSDSRL